RGRPASGSRSCATSCKRTGGGYISTAHRRRARASRSSCRGAEMATILVTDDEANIRNHLASYVRSFGHEVETAASGAEALAAIGRRHFDLVFSDVRMARMDGLALLGEIGRRAPETTVVLMTAYATVAQAVEAIRAGAHDYLVKPFGFDQVDLVLQR